MSVRRPDLSRREMLKRFGWLVLAVAVVGGAALVSLLVGASHQVVDLVVISGALLVGYLVDLRPAGRHRFQWPSPSFLFSYAQQHQTSS